MCVMCTCACVCSMHVPMCHVCVSVQYVCAHPRVVLTQQTELSSQIPLQSRLTQYLAEVQTLVLLLEIHPRPLDLDPGEHLPGRASGQVSCVPPGVTEGSPSSASTVSCSVAPAGPRAGPPARVPAQWSVLCHRLFALPSSCFLLSVPPSSTCCSAEKISKVGDFKSRSFQI